MRQSSLSDLKQKLLQEKNLGTVWSFFMDHFGENAAFMSRGQPARHSLVEALVAQVGKAMFGGAGAVVGLALTRLAEDQFIHGAFSVDGRFGTIFYFEDIDTGLMSVAEGLLSEQVKFARFSARTAREVAPPSVN